MNHGYVRRVVHKWWLHEAMLKKLKKKALIIILNMLIYIIRSNERMKNVFLCNSKTDMQLIYQAIIFHIGYLLKKMVLRK